MKTHLSDLIKTSGLILGFLFLNNCTGPGKQPTAPESPNYPVEFSLSKAELMDKIMGGWAGQTIGCTYGGPTEFKYNGSMINDNTPIAWDDTRMDWYYANGPGLYDDIYMDLTFVEVIEKEGIDAPASSHAHAFANAEYALWHANQSARYNILHGIQPPASGYWENNPHADDIDFQIEADFAGLMSPGMVNPASEICDRVGHIMNYGDGWYGGVYVAAMYALAFYTDDIEMIVSEALKSIPAESDFYQCMSDVIHWYHQYPGDWKRTWFETEKKWSFDVGCPAGVFKDFNIDAKINAAYILIGLLYGEKDFGKTIDISTRCGQDSDCNPASSGGILGTILGYSNIPEYWKQGIEKVEDIDFKYTTISLKDAYDMSHRHAVEMIKRNGGEEAGDMLTILLEEPQPVRFEKAFDGHFPVEITDFGWDGKLLEYDGQVEHGFDFEGKGFVIPGHVRKLDADKADMDILLDVYIDGEHYEQAVLPTSYRARRNDLTWKYNLEDGPHKVRIVWNNPQAGYAVVLAAVQVYGPEAIDFTK